MPIELIALLAVLVIATSSAAWAYAASRPRTSVLSRIAGYPIGAAPVLLPGASVFSRIGDWLSRFMPGWLVTKAERRDLVYAGFATSTAPGWFGLARVVLVATIPTLLYLRFHALRPVMMMSVVALGFAIALLAPMAWLAHMRIERQDRIRKSLPDALDLLLVCVEAGVSLDAAILRVGRELMLMHPDIGEELLMLNRRENAGMSREDALKGLYERTGVPELRVLATNINQSERWGTSMSRVLRVDSETLRRQRRERAEKRAALAAVKMVFPLVLLILPALLAVVWGSALLNIHEVFNAHR